jgi:hypothetical protein
VNIIIALVLDPNFGRRLATLVTQMPVWVISSSVNDLEVKDLRSRMPECSITILLAKTNEELAEQLQRGLYAIDDHHGPSSTSKPYTIVRVYGAQPSLARETLAELGLGSVTSTLDGFDAQK